MSPEGFEEEIVALLDRLTEQMFDSLPVVAPGVNALVVDHSDRIEVVTIAAQNEGTGAVGRWLDALPADRTVWVPLVTSDRLAGMLDRRGFTLTSRHLSDTVGRAPVWIRDAA